MNEDRNERMARLKQQAIQALRQEPAIGSGTVPPPDLHKLLEDLRIYQVELELQNEELRLAQQQAALASSRYQLLFDSLPLPAFVVDRHALVQQSNDVAQSWLGPCRSPGMQDFRLAHGIARADRPRFLSALSDAQGVGGEFVRGINLTDCKGVLRWVDAHVIKLPQAFHADHRYTVVLMDRSDEAAREQDRQLYQAVLDSSDDLIYATDETGRCLLANQATLRLVGLPHDKVLGRRRDAVLPLRDAILQDISDQKVLQSGQPLTLQEEMHAAPGESPQTFTTRKFPLKNAKGEVWGVGGISRDITAALQSQLHLSWSELAFASTSQAIVITDANTRILRVNRAFERMSGFSEATVLGQRTSILRSGRQGADFYREMWARLNQDGRWAGELTNRNAEGRFYAVWTCIDEIRNADDERLGYLAVQTDLTELRRGQAEVERLASTDSLTGLPNRSLLEDRIGQLLTFSARQSSQFGVLFVDLDHFKQVNDALGHQAGDQLLQAIAQRLQNSVRAQDTVARMGGDEFVLLLPSTGRDDALAIAEKIQQNLGLPLTLAGRDGYTPEASIGLAMYPHDGQTAAELLSNADTAMYAAKTGGRHRTLPYTDTMSQENARALALQLDLQRGLDQHELRVHLQPKFNLRTLDAVGLEALVRWERPEHGLTEPEYFLGIAARGGLLRDLDLWVLERVLEHVSAWRTAGLWPEGWRAGVNQDVSTVGRTDYIQTLTQLLSRYPATGNCIEIEISESALAKPPQTLLSHLKALQTLGVTVCIDDFGTGYSSLSYLQSLPVSTIKIDRTFTQDMLVDEGKRVLMGAMIDLGHKLGHTMVAEGVETPEQQEALVMLGCETGQGFRLDEAVEPQLFEDRHLRTLHL